MSASTGHLRPGSAGEARRRVLALALPVLGLVALIASLPVGGAAIPTTGLFSCSPPIDPRNCASPKQNTPPSDATNQ